jgi:hypothetical protein
VHGPTPTTSCSIAGSGWSTHCLQSRSRSDRLQESRPSGSHSIFGFFQGPKTWQRFYSRFLSCSYIILQSASSVIPASLHAPCATARQPLPAELPQRTSSTRDGQRRDASPLEQEVCHTCHCRRRISRFSAPPFFAAHATSSCNLRYPSVLLTGLQESRTQGHGATKGAR